MSRTRILRLGVKLFLMLGIVLGCVKDQWMAVWCLASLIWFLDCYDAYYFLQNPHDPDHPHNVRRAAGRSMDDWWPPF